MSQGVYAIEAHCVAVNIDNFGAMASKEEIKELLKIQKSKIEKVITDNTNELKEDLMQMKKMWEGAVADVILNREKIESLEFENVELTKRIQELEQRSRIDNIIITGIKKSEDEDEDDLLREVTALAQKLEVELNPYDVNTIHRLPANTQGIHPVIVKLNNRSKSPSW